MSARVLILSSEFPPGPGGIGTHAYQLALQLRQHGWEVSVAAPQELADEGSVATFRSGLPFEFHRLERFGPAPVKLGYRLAMVTRLLRHIRPSLMIASGERMVWLAALLRRVHGVPFVAIGHAMEFNVRRRWQRAINRAAFEAASAVICVSQYTRSRMEAAQFRVATTAVIPNGADETLFRRIPDVEAAAFRREHRLEHATLLVTVGSVHERKGQDVVIRALPHVLERFPDVHYVLVGYPYRRKAFAALAARLGVERHVHFLGALSSSALVQALNAADLFIMASQHTPAGDFEGYGIAVVEAALCGRAAVVSDNSGVIEAIEPGETGLVAAIADPRSLAVRIMELLEDRSRLARMERLARERALGLKTWTRRGAEYDRFLRAVVAATASRHEAGMNERSVATD